MLSKLFNKEYPEFWKKYTSSFKNPATKYVVLSLETSGLDTKKDVIMSIAATSIIDNRIIIKDSFEIFIQHTKHEIHNFDNDFISVSKIEKVFENVAIETLLNFLENAVLIGHRIDFDIEIINEVLSKMKLGTLRNESFDIEAMFNKVAETNDKKYAIEEMCNILNISKSLRNSVVDDVYVIGLLFLKLKSKLGIK